MRPCFHVMVRSHVTRTTLLQLYFLLWAIIFDRTEWCSDKWPQIGGPTTTNPPCNYIEIRKSASHVSWPIGFEVSLADSLAHHMLRLTTNPDGDGGSVDAKAACRICWCRALPAQGRPESRWPPRYLGLVLPSPALEFCQFQGFLEFWRSPPPLVERVMGSAPPTVEWRSQLQVLQLPVRLRWYHLHDWCESASQSSRFNRRSNAKRPLWGWTKLKPGPEACKQRSRSTASRHRKELWHPNNVVRTSSGLPIGCPAPASSPSFHRDLLTLRGIVWWPVEILADPCWGWTAGSSLRQRPHHWPTRAKKRFKGHSCEAFATDIALTSA